MVAILNGRFHVRLFVVTEDLVTVTDGVNRQTATIHHSMPYVEALYTRTCHI
jgi:hypothetical protein